MRKEYDGYSESLFLNLKPKMYLAEETFDIVFSTTDRRGLMHSLALLD